MMFLVEKRHFKMSDEDAYRKEFYQLMNHDLVHEGNWGAWLGGHGKLKSFTWIGNKNSGNKIRNGFNSEVVPNYKNVEKEDYKFDNYNFENHIFVWNFHNISLQITGIILLCLSVHLKNLVEKML